ncbi:PAS domain-containing protein [Spirosoma agri]|nr:PAS domain-containing protein [Spirosoma agri]
MPIPIVAIGASAGGIEAVSELLRHLSPTTGLAYVYIQHLDPTVESHISDILSRSTTMPVLEAQHLLRIEPNHVYVIPPDQDIEAVDGVLTLLPRDKPGNAAIHMPIDQFFLSLAERQKAGSIGVLLSGTATDGTLGLRAIKAAGGITFAQDETARFLSMPRSAISEGVVDRVLPPTEIALELDQLSQQPAVFQQTLQAELQEAEGRTDEDLTAIIQLLRRMVGADFSHYKLTTVRRRIIRRTLLYKLNTLSEYADYMRQHPEEASLLYDDLLINVTSFFRDADTMDYLQKVLFPQLIRDKPSREPLRIWIPACSTGQEAYTIAMLLLEVLGDRASTMTVQIFATDLSESAVAKARMGSYTRGEVIDVQPSRLQRFFTKVDDHFRINKSVRDMCVFAPHNLLKDPPFSRLDLISCRNLLIYLDTTLQRKAIVTFHYALNPSGYLVLGKSETVGTSAPLFSQIEKNYKIFLRKNDVDSRATFTMSPRQLDSQSAAPSNRLLPSQKTSNLSAERSANSGNDLDNLIDNLLLTQYVPACVLVNQDLEILQFRGSTGLFLEPSPGKASLNLLKMARPSLVFELRNTVHKAQKSGEPVRKSGLEVRLKDKVHYVSVEAVPLNTSTEERLFLIIFEEAEPPVVPVTRSADARNRRIKELETELANLREDMRSIIEEQEASNEELQSANEEIISSNEELQSINEELETSKEEIESTNEELLTINQELQVRNDQLSEAYQFAEDIFGTIREATLVLDTDLRVKSANQTFYRLFGTKAEDTERRLLYELAARQWDIPELRMLLMDVATRGTQIHGFEFTYSSGDGSDSHVKVLSLNARRVVRQQEAILLAIEDITEHRRAQRLLAEREAWFHQIADNAPSLIWVTGPDDQYTFINRVWADYTGRSLDDITKYGWSPNLHPDDRKLYQDSHTKHVGSQQPFSFEYRLRRYDGEYRWMLENAQPVFAPDGTFGGYIGSAADVNLQKELNQELDLRVQERTSELAQTNNLLQSIFDSSLNSVSVLESVRDESGELIDFVYQLTNDATEQVVGQTNLEGKRYSTINSAYKEVGLFDILKRVVETGESERFPLHYIDETIDQWHECSAVKLNDGVVLSSEDITERRLIEGRIQDSEASKQSLLSIFGQAPVGIAMFKGARFIIDLANERMLDYWARTRAQVMKKPLADALPELAGQLFEASLTSAYTTKQRVFANELPLTFQHQEKRVTVYIDLAFEPYYGADKSVAGVLVVANDVTQQVLARQLIETNERQLRTLVEHTPDVITRWDSNLKLIFANQAFAGKMGLPNTALLGKTNLEMEQPGDIAVAYMDSLEDVLRTGKPKEHYNSFPSPSGEIFFYSRMVPEFGEDGSVQGVLAIARDITKLKEADDLREAEQKVRETVENLQAILDSSPTLIIFFKESDTQDPLSDFHIAVCNDKVVQLLGKPVDQLIGQPVSQFADRLWQENTRSLLRQVRETSEPYHEERYMPTESGGSWLAIYVTQFDHGVVLTGVNITALKQAEQQQDLLLKEIEQSNENIQLLSQLRQQIRERGEFLRSTSHDLRGNFGIIQGAATLLDMANTDEERSQMLSMLQRNLRQVTQLLTELMDFSRLEADQEQRQILPFNVTELLIDLVERVRPIADEQGLWLHLEADEPITAEGDPVKVRRIAQNLVFNALRYTQTGGITVSLKPALSPDHWQFTITDTGPGLIQPESLADESFTADEGISLLIAKQLCELLNASFEIDSQSGIGTRVQVIFPRRYS